MKTDDLREAFLDYFASQGCIRRPSDVLVPNDPTVLFTPAGMNQFKREFMGLGDPGFRRAVTCQKCIRTGDIENVGKTPRHMTFFEMLGNFSFGDYFKREAIHWAYEFLTKTLKIPAGRLTYTVYLDDDDAYDIWHDEVGIPADRITRMGEDDNFWPAGARRTGPTASAARAPRSSTTETGSRKSRSGTWSSPSSTASAPASSSRFPRRTSTRAWASNGPPRRSRACGRTSRSISSSRSSPPRPTHSGSTTPRVQDTHDGVRIRRASDHARALTFCIHENVRPGPEKQGYVVRRLLRRAVLDAYQMGQREPFLFRLPPVIAESMNGGYPELRDSVPRIQNVIREEEERFLRNLENGLGLLNDTFKKTKAAGSDVIAGDAAFDLLSTYGIPVEVTESLAADQNLRVDTAGFEASRVRFSAVSRGTTEAADVFATGPLDTLKEAYHHGTEFLGYQATEAEGTVIGILEQGQLAESAVRSDSGPPIALILDRSPFYGEAGGQVGDVGTIQGADFAFQVEDTRRDHDFVLHLGRVTQGTLNLNARATAAVDADRRQAIRRAHSATHLLHHALHRHLGKHAQQAGSKVEPDRLRFDFANPEAVGKERLEQIEKTVNALVMTGSAVDWSLMPIAEAKSLGAMALFGEKYPDIVRVVRMGDFSKELCGGTHLDNVGQVGLFKLIGEESVASGTRRITALTGQAAIDYVRQEEELLAQVASALRVPQGQVGDRVMALLEEIKTLKKQAAQRKPEAGSKVSADELLAGAHSIQDATVVIQSLEDHSPDEMRMLIDGMRRKKPSGLAVLLMTAAEGKVQLVAALSSDLVSRGLHAGNWLKQVAAIVGGGGGGRPDLAQAGGKTPEKIPDALEQALKSIQGILKS